MHVAMLTPLKDPDHPEPSGDRAMARLLRAALLEAGCTIDVPSRRRMLDRRGDTALFHMLPKPADANTATNAGAATDAVPHGEPATAARAPATPTPHARLETRVIRGE